MNSKAFYNSKKLNNIVSVRDFGATGTGDDTAAIQSAITYCNTNNCDVYFPVGTYTTTASITNLHNVRSTGPGKISRGTDTWSIEPKNSEINILYCGSAGSNSNDGLSSSTPITIQRAVEILRSVREKGLEGVWRIQLLAGTYTEAGVKLANIPSFKNKIQIWGTEPTALEPAALIEGKTYEITVVGDTNWTGIGATQATVGTVFIKDNTTATGTTGRAIDKNAVPTSIWNSPGDGEWAFDVHFSELAIHALYNVSNPTSLGFHLKNIKFQNWTQQGAVRLYHPGVDLIENIHVSDSRIGIQKSKGIAMIVFGVMSNITSSAAYATDNATLTMIEENGYGTTFDSCKIGFYYTTYSVGLVAYCKFTDVPSGGAAIYSSSGGRFRQSHNDFTAVGTVYSQIMNVGGLMNNSSTSASTYPDYITGKPFVSLSEGGRNDSIHKGSPVHTHKVSYNSTSTFNIANSAGESSVLLSTKDTSWTPFNFPAWTLFSAGVMLHTEVILTLTAGASGVLGLMRAGTSSIAKATVTSTTTKTGVVTFRTHIPYGDILSTYIESNAFGIYERDTVSANDSAIRDKVDSLLTFRLYWLPQTNPSVEFVSMRTRVE